MSKLNTLFTAALVTVALTACGKSKDNQQAPTAAPQTVVESTQEAVALAAELSKVELRDIHSLSQEQLNSLSDKVSRLADLDSTIDSGSEFTVQATEHKTLIQTLRNAISLERSQRQLAVEVADAEAAQQSKAQAPSSTAERLKKKLEEAEKYLEDLLKRLQ